MEIRLGATRVVLIFNQKLVLKIPQISAWKLFLLGLLANLQERQFSLAGWPELCSVIAANQFGFWLIMPYARPLSDEEWEKFEYAAFSENENYIIPVENKRDSFGVLSDRIVAVDYGS